MTEKFDNLLSILQEMQSVVLAFSGGVDSTFLLKAIKESESFPCRNVLFRDHA